MACRKLPTTSWESRAQGASLWSEASCTSCLQTAYPLSSFCGRLMLELVKKLDDELKHKAAQLAAFYEHRLQVSAAHPSPPHIHLSHGCSAYAAPFIVKFHEFYVLGQSIA